MQKPKIDRNRLDVLKSITVREKSALQATQDEVSTAIDRANTMHREIKDMTRQLERGTNESIERRLRALQSEKVKLDKKIEEMHLDIEIARERSNAAKRLNKRCADYAAETGNKIEKDRSTKISGDRGAAL